ncbi:uncharacterized protein LOC131051716 isoform X4 [Cryptomeria japonica]|uniref:uncharacterized protein LOC131051716 isoform X4 n=1 Tax=Cryptomeria japonica TaxID=3369 RepID=UPI0027DA67BE|nr:uncharacterized protein LOC131051716 isoform X4 [Cryptomeria japonica]
MDALLSGLLNPQPIRRAVIKSLHLELNSRLGNEHNHSGRSRVSYQLEAGKYGRWPNTLCRANSSRESNDKSGISAEDEKGWLHFVGIGGSGLSALAMLALKQGWKVSGSDVTWSIYMNALKRAGARLYIGHSSTHLLEKDKPTSLPVAVVVSAAIPEDNEEISFAHTLGIQIYKRDAWLAKITQKYNVIAVSGSHGKSTTAAMLAFVLHSLGDDITAIVGANVPQAMALILFWSPGLHSLLGLLQPKKWATCELTSESSEWVHFNTACRIMTYGHGEHNDWRAVSLMPNAIGGTDYVVSYAGMPMAKVRLKLPGAHNVMNSLAVIASVAALTKQQNRSFDVRNDLRATQEVVKAASKHLGNFIGIRRRFEFIGKIQGCDIYDDYAHHPTEVCAVLQAARQRFSDQALWVVFQPHMYSRLAGLLQDFALAFNCADRVIITKVYAAREKNIWNISGKDLASSIIGPSTEYIPELEGVLERLVCEIPSYLGEIVIFTLGAGDITTLGPRLLSSLT